MNIFNKLTLQYIKMNKARTIVTIIGVILSVTMICSTIILSSSMLECMEKEVIHNSGNWYGKKLNADYEVFEKIKETEEVDSIVYNQQIGYARLMDCENEFKPYLYIIGATHEIKKMLPVHITSGRFPNKNNEILIPEHLAESGGIRYEIGDEVTFDIGDRTLDGKNLTQETSCYVYNYMLEEVHNGENLKLREKRTYKVVGFYERPAFEKISSPGYTAITYIDTDENRQYKYDVYYRTKNVNDIYKLIEKDDIYGVHNVKLLSLYGTKDVNSFVMTLKTFEGVLTVLTMFVAVALIYNAFSISVIERTKQFGLLSSLGATKGQLKKMVRLEALIISIIGIPVGLLLGITGIAITLKLVKYRFTIISTVYAMELNISKYSIIMSVLIAVITVLIAITIPLKRATSINTIDAVRVNNISNIKRIKTPKIIYRLFGVSGVLADKYYKRSKRRYNTIIYSLIFSIVMFISIVSYTENMMKEIRLTLDKEYDLILECSLADFDEISEKVLVRRLMNIDSIDFLEYNHYMNDMESDNEKILAYYITSEKYTTAAKEIKEVLRDAGVNQYTLTNNIKIYEQEKNNVMLIRVFSYGFIVLFSLVAVANAFITILFSMNLRNREFAMLKSLGISDKGLKRMVYYECMVYGIKSLGLGIPLAIAISYGLFTTQNNISVGFEYNVPVKAVILAIIGVVVIVYSTMLYSVNKTKNIDIISSLKGELQV